MEARDPFLDRRLVDFCAHLPGHLLVRDGLPKAILRDVMADKLPTEVCLGRGKPHIGWAFAHKFLEREKSRGKLTQTELANTLAGYVDSNKLDKAWSTFENGTDAGAIHTAYVLCLWLRQTVSRPVVKNQPFGYSSAIEQ